MFYNVFQSVWEKMLFVSQQAGSRNFLFIRVTSSSCAKTRRAFSWRASASAAANVAGNSKLRLLKMLRNTKHFAAFSKWCFPKLIWKLAFSGISKLHSWTLVTHLLLLRALLWQWRVIWNYIFFKWKYETFCAISEMLFSKVSLKTCLFWHFITCFCELKSHISFHFEPCCDNDV